MAGSEGPEEERNDTEERSAETPDRGPGAHSGLEQEARERVVPGTASAAEGYSGGGTGAGEPLEGVEDDEAAKEAGEPEGS
ncbi:hypothetical protein [Streptomyces sp. UH6]|uniref:hypothetical protein n=1 Tax=Streptomyces sp. UH6 TaxID=2748379 RepID=UPI0015D4F0D7|nr:hypothetical protein [Streptomyces sp. UH6]NYV75625.1 hypothetical protein [Streptomyces sp. UH6]